MKMEQMEKRRVIALFCMLSFFVVSVYVVEAATPCRMDLSFELIKDWREIPDGDHIPNWWEVKWTESLDLMTDTSDSDKDDFLDYAEYLAGTDPMNPVSFLHMTDIRSSGGEIVFEWMSETLDETQRVYNVYAADTLAELMSGGGVQIASGVVGAGAVTSVSVSPQPGAEGLRFYRVEVVGKVGGV